MADGRGPKLSLRRDGGELVVPLVLRETLVGRIDSNHIVLDDPSVSRVHARFLLGRDGSEQVVEVEDCGSSLGTQVNGDLIDRARLRAGDVISIGSVLLTFSEG
jgi:pSer/pThr/pTyr-binding forkhead associated (FHA) protein